MTDRPILFSGPMVRALLDGRKTQTRRIIKPQPFASGYYDGEIEINVIQANDQYPKAFRFNANAVGGGAILEEVFEPRINAGDRLWVRENVSAYDDVEADSLALIYEADELKVSLGDRHSVSEDVGEKWWLLNAYRTDNPDIDGGKRVPSIHMPRWASRVTLIVTDVHVERLQDISEAEAIAEGAKQYSSSTKLSRAFNPDWKGIYRQGYAELWNAINGPGSWEANPWVAAYTFSVIRQNIDQIARAA
ncbi:hypothetical protein [Sinorhizobium medicae]|uniref:hypothetical protein n=1 Tax=Sinorhizobium medicae TaxID=110321 RepID=UPI000C7A99D0|nr:hypothetical protein [Sinorhizobium medicae]MBO1940210.1 hypothetical protein [Sinorhizobium medicae]MDX0937808.1 hypothetical protein [Sinorhizobium medicae]MDX0943447.1 hypothetical protein [Sinorhizobium medicae]PLT85316.1 hypothetical protein BMJ35_23110 [Sinorhizobium medicae]PLT95530.1 hypothetical protein BMJ32_29740 [Sinorhizobium medicae]